MALLRSRWLLFSLAFTFVAAVVVGCGRRDLEDENPGPLPSSRGGGAAAQETPIKPGTATIKGRITVSGAPSEMELNEKFVATIEKNASATDRPHCLNVGDHVDQKHEQDWKFGSDKGLADVLVYLRPPSGSYFAVNPEDPRVLAARKGPAVIDQPHCVYVPHVIRLLPRFRDLKGTEEKGVQSLLLRNTSKIGHNVAFPGGNVPVSSGGGEYTIDFFKPEYVPYTISCKIHPWMNASILVLDHPYSAITNEKGEFEIKDAPVGKVRLIVWHGTKPGFVTPNKARGEEIELKAGEVTEKTFEVPYQP